MPRFRFIAKDRSGKTRKGAIDAANRSEAAETLAMNGFSPELVEPADTTENETESHPESDLLTDENTSSDSTLKPTVPIPEMPAFPDQPAPQRPHPAIATAPSNSKGNSNSPESTLLNRIYFVAIIIAVIMLANSFYHLRPSTWQYKSVEILAKSPAGAILSNQQALAYKTIPDTQPMLDTLGSEGWELVSTYLEHETSHPNFGKEDYVTGIQPNTRPQKLVCIFKKRR